MTLLLAAGCEPVASSWTNRESLTSEDYTATASTLTEVPDEPSSLRVMTWNLKFAGGRVDFFFDGHGDRVHMTEDEVAANMAGIYGAINEQDPDVLLAQEVDRRSKRSDYFDMVTGIVENTDMNYAVWVPVWEARYIPEEGLGPMRMGQAVFSKYPLTGNDRLNLPQSTESSAVVNYFWLHRAVQVTRVELGGGDQLTVINNHPTAYALDGTKQRHLDAIIAETNTQDTNPVVCGGDFNVPPPGTIRLDNFPDYAETNTTGVTEVVYTVEETDAMQPLYDEYDAVVPLDEYKAAATEADQSAYFSHSVSGDVFWVVKLDFLFTNLTWTDGATLQSAGDGSPALVADPMQLSDHAPMMGVLDLDGGR